jgi:hypothetical protein
MQVWLNIESYVFFNLLSKFEEKSHNIADGSFPPSINKVFFVKQNLLI